MKAEPSASGEMKWEAEADRYILANHALRITYPDKVLHGIRVGTTTRQAFAADSPSASSSSVAAASDPDPLRDLAVEWAHAESRIAVVISTVAMEMETELGDGENGEDENEQRSTNHHHCKDGRDGSHGTNYELTKHDEA